MFHKNCCDYEQYTRLSVRTTQRQTYGSIRMDYTSYHCILYLLNKEGLVYMLRRALL